MLSYIHQMIMDRHGVHMNQAVNGGAQPVHLIVKSWHHVFILVTYILQLTVERHGHSKTRLVSHTWHAIAVSGDEIKLIMAGYDPSQIYQSTDYGVTWTATGNSKPWYDIKISDDRQTIVAASTGGAEISRDGGVRWSSLRIRKFYKWCQ